MSVAFETFIHLIAGGIGGTIGAIVTCPLEVVKTRQQSSDSFYSSLPAKHGSDKGAYAARQAPAPPPPPPHSSAAGLHPLESGGSRFLIWRHIRHIIENESPRALFKGLGPNLVGVAPSRAIYFCTYSTVKDVCNTNFNSPDTPLVHMSAAASAGFVSSTLTNPIWFIKTRLQLDQSKYGSQNTFKYIVDLYREVGFVGLYKGITASYFGISETIIHFVIYEFIKSKLKERRERICKANDEEYRESGYHVLQFMLAGAVSKTCASIMTYPHEVARTRLRQAGSKYRTFIQTLRLVYSEEGRQGLYRGLGTQLIRQIPNTAIMMVTYELIVYLFKSTQSSSS